MTAGAGVQDQDRPAAGRPVLLAHHELAAVRGRRPVDPAQVVAVAVGADGDVVLAVQGHHVRDGALGADAVTAGVPAAERLHAGQHGDLGGPGQRRSRRSPARTGRAPAAPAGRGGGVRARASGWSRSPPGARRAPSSAARSAGRSPRTWSIRSSASCTGLRRGEVFSKTISTRALWSTVSRAGCTRRVTPTDGRAAAQARAASSGRPTSSTPMRVTSGKPSAIPDRVRVRPAATNARPRTVRTSRDAGHRTVHPAGVERQSRDGHAGRAHGAGTGTRRTRSRSTSAVDRRASCGLAGGDDPVREHRDDQCLHVVGQDVVAAGEGGVRPAPPAAGAGWRAGRRPGAGRACCGSR